MIEPKNASLLVVQTMVALLFGHTSNVCFASRQSIHTNRTLNSSLELCTRWTVFTTPLHQVTQFRGQQAGPLTGCVLCVSQDGTIVVIVIDGFQL